MSTAPLLRAACLAPTLALAACTLNVQSVDRTLLTATSEEITALTSDLTAAELGDVSVVVGPTDTDPTVGVAVRGLVAFDRSIDDVLATLHVGFDTSTTPAGLAFEVDGAREEGLAIEDLELALRPGTTLDLTTSAGSVEVRGLASDAHIVASSGSIDVEGALDVALRTDSGSIRVEAETGVLEASSGSIELALTGAVDAHTSSGSIHGEFGGGGELACSSGSLDLELVGPLDRDLTLTTSSGSITLLVPADLAARVEASAGTGSVEIAVGDVTHDGDFVGALGGGGDFVIRATAGSGSIRIAERAR